MPILTEHYRGRRILVTGHTGFKGSWLVLWLRELGAEVAGFALQPDTTPSLFELANVEHACDHNVGDIRDEGALLRLFERVRPHTVFHLAAQPLVRRSYQDPKETFDVNVGGTVSLLEAIRRAPSVESAVLITTDKVYENREWLYGYRECDALGGHDPYSASKAAAEIAIASYRRSFFDDGAGRNTGIASVRAGNVIGGGDWAEDRILPDAVRAIAAGRMLDVRNPESVRPWQHVLEPLGGYLALGLRLQQAPRSFEGAFNLGPAPHDTMKVRELVDAFFGTVGRGSWRDASALQAGAVHEARLLGLACDRAHRVLGWRPVLDTRQAVSLTAAWYRDVVFGGMSAFDRCLSDLEGYVRAATAAAQWWAI